MASVFSFPTPEVRAAIRRADENSRIIGLVAAVSVRYPATAVEIGYGYSKGRIPFEEAELALERLRR
jgi:hypothetical protein